MAISLFCDELYLKTEEVSKSKTKNFQKKPTQIDKTSNYCVAQSSGTQSQTVKICLKQCQLHLPKMHTNDDTYRDN